MIPRPPVDPRLRERLDLALSAPRMLALLREALPAEAAAALAEVQPIALFLESGCAIHLRYTLRQVGGAEASTRLSAHVGLRAEGAPRSLRPGPAAVRVQGMAHGARLALPELDADLEVLPRDQGLPGLPAAFDLERVARVLAVTAAAAAGPPEIRRCRLLEHRPGRRALLRYSLRGSSGARYVHGQLGSAAEASRLLALSAALARTGLVLPRALGLLPAEGLLLQQRAAGRSLASLSPAEAGAQIPALLRLCARVSALPEARSSLPALRLAVARLEAWDPEARAAVAARRSAALLPELGRRIEGLAERAARTLSARSRGQGIVHAGLWAERLRVTAGGIALDDLAGLVRGPRELGVAGLAADLALREADGRMELGGLRASWLAAIEAQVDPVALAAAEALMILCRLSEPLARLEADWPEKMAGRLALAEARLPAQEEGNPRKGAVSTPSGLPARRQRHDVGARIPDARADAVGASATRGTTDPGARPVPIPIDPALPQLATLRDAAAMSERLGEALAVPDLERVSIELMRHKPGRRCLLRYRLRRAEAGSVWLVGKTFASSRGPRVCQLHRQIHAHAALGPQVRVPEVLAYLPDVKLLLLSQLPGADLAPRLLAGDRRVATAMAGALASLHGSRLELEREHGLEHELQPLDRRLRALEGDCPELGAAARRVLADLVDGLEPWRRRWRRMPAHRDCYHEQFLYGPAGLAGLDFDDAAMSEPCLDAGNLLAHLSLLGWQHPRQMGRVARSRAAFERGLADSAIGYPAGLLSAMECASLLRLVAIHQDGPDGARVARGLLLSARARLRAGGLVAPKSGPLARTGIASGAKRRA